MPGINETATWGFQPMNFSNYTLADTFFEYRQNFLKSANDPLRYQIQLFNGAMTEATPATAVGDTVNVVFDCTRQGFELDVHLPHADAAK